MKTLQKTTELPPKLH